MHDGSVVTEGITNNMGYNDIKNDDEEGGGKEEDGNVCSICLGELGQEVCASTKRCQHTFHQTCLNAWIKQSLSCPICREDILTIDRLRDYMATNRRLLKRD